MSRTSDRIGRRTLLWLLSCGLAAPAAPAQTDPTLTPVIVAERGSPLAGSTAGALLRIEGFDVDNAGRVIARALTGQGQRVVIRDLDWLLPLDGTLPSGQVVQTDPHDPVASSSDGRVAWIGRLDGDGDAALLLDDSVLLAPGDVLSGPDMPAGATLLDAHSVAMNDAHQLLLFGRLQVGSDTAEGLVRLTPNVDLTAWSAELVAMEQTATPDGLLVRALVDDRAKAFDLAEDGSVLYFELTYAPDFPQFTFGGVRSWPGYTLLVPWADPLFWTLVQVDLRWSSDGQWAGALGPDFPAPTPMNFIVHDGDTVVTADEVLPGQTAPAPLLRGLQVGANDNLAFLHRGGDPAFYSLYLNDRLMLRPGDVVAGRTIEAIQLPQFAPFSYNPARPFALDRAGETLWVSVVFTDGEWGLLRLDIGPWVSLGASLAGAGTVVPRLAASGSLQAGTPAPLAILDGVPGAPAFLVVGLTELAAPFKGGVLHPNPDLILGGLPLDANGSWSTSNPWPSGLPAGVALFWQSWMPDPGAPVGFSATHCLRSTTP